jgi:mannose-6-phosphate isomerase class I
MDRHWAALAPHAERYVDLSDIEQPRSVAMADLTSALRDLSRRPFRTRPTFQPGVWGGQWLKAMIGAQGVDNLAWSYELIAPESQVTLGTDVPVRVNLSFLLHTAADAVLGERVRARFGDSFPIRMDYLDTMDGGHLSAHCHPQRDYARAVFGLPYTQHESYYVMETRPGSKIFLGLRDDVDLEGFRRAVEAASDHAVPFALEEFALAHDAERHQLYLIPAGTLHASGRDNVVLEISSTPYLYSLRL